MANIRALTQPEIIDREALREFADALADRAAEIERDISKLGREPDNRALIADIFRSMHNIKGDAALCKVETAGMIAHPIESLLTRLRSGEARFTPLLGEVVLLALDRLELATEALLAGKPVAHMKLVELVQGLEHISLAQQEGLDSAAAQLIESVTGFRPQTNLRATPARLPAQGIPNGQGSVPVDDEISSTLLQPSPAGRGDERALRGFAKGNTVADLAFFRALALQFEARSPLFKGRTVRLRQLALDTSRAGGSPVDAAQLEAAVYMHDVGMMFIPEAVWLKVGGLNAAERDMLHAHPGFGAGLLERMGNWNAAAEMVRQHHEMPDGGGYPDRLRADGICPGAKILAIADAFEAVMLKHSTRGHNRSVLRAAAEVNACNNQFAPEWIEPFNSVVRRMVEH